MNEPVTTMDSRYSDPQAVATPWEETRRVLETAELFWLSTVRADGRPHATPLVAVWLDGAIYFCTGVSEQKARNLRGNPHVLLLTGRTQWNAGLDVVVEGDAGRVTDQDRLEQLAQAWVPKWDGRWKYLVRDGCFYAYNDHEVRPDHIFVFSVTPTRVYAYSEGDPFSHTRHQF